MGHWMYQSSCSPLASWLVAPVANFLAWPQPDAWGCLTQRVFWSQQICHWLICHWLPFILVCRRQCVVPHFPAACVFAYLRELVRYRRLSIRPFLLWPLMQLLWCDFTLLCIYWGFSEKKTHYEYRQVWLACNESAYFSLKCHLRKWTRFIPLSAFWSICTLSPLPSLNEWRARGDSVIQMLQLFNYFIQTARSVTFLKCCFVSRVYEWCWLRRSSHRVERDWPWEAFVC